MESPEASSLSVPLTPPQIKEQAESLSLPQPPQHVLLTDAQANALAVMLADDAEKLAAFKDMLTTEQIKKFFPDELPKMGSLVGGRSRRRRRSKRSKSMKRGRR